MFLNNNIMIDKYLLVYLFAHSRTLPSKDADYFRLTKHILIETYLFKSSEQVCRVHGRSDGQSFQGFSSEIS